MFKLSEYTLEKILEIAEINSIDIIELEKSNKIHYILNGAQSIVFKNENYKYILLTPINYEFYKLIGSNLENEFSEIQELYIN